MPQSAPIALRRRSVLLFVTALLSSAAAIAAPPVNTLKPGFFGGRGEVAIVGYDPVAYFTAGQPVKGQEGLSTEWMGATWRFSSAANLALFKAAPEKYAPQYGGYCAYGVSQDKLVSIEPDKFKIVDGKLYLNYDADVQALWLKDPAGYIRQADARFAALLKK